MKDIDEEFKEFYEENFKEKITTEELPMYAYKLFCGGYRYGMKDCLELINKERKECVE